VATEKHIADDPSFRSYLRQMDATELREYMKTATLDAGGQAYLNARIESLEAPAKLQQSARRILGLTEGKTPAVTLVPMVRKQFEAIANAEITKGQTEIEVPSGQDNVSLGKEAVPALQVIEQLANATEGRRQTVGGKSDTLGIVSFVRAGQGMHGSGLAFDISAYGGHQFNESNPAEARAAAAAVLKDLPAGYYGFGLPRLPTKVAIPENAKYSQEHFKDMQLRPGDYGLPSTKEWTFSPDLRQPIEGVRNREDPFISQPQTAAELGRFGDATKITDPGTRAAISTAQGRGVFVTPFADQFGHLHLSVVWKGAKMF
jgi:hypothetical protein